MDPSSLQKLPMAQLARMLDPAALPGWSDAETGPVLRHQLGAPLLPDLISTPGAEVARIEALVTHRGNAGSFVDQLTSPCPSVELLEAIKRFARHVREDGGSPLHGAPSIVIYYASIAAAIVRCKARITQLADSQLLEGFAWSEVQPGSEDLSVLFQMAAAELSRSTPAA